MPVKSVIDVEVNDKAFTAFYEKFSQYKQELSELPVLWGESDTALKETANALTDMVKAMTDLSKVNKNLTDGFSKVEGFVKKTDNSMVKLVKTTGQFANFIKDTTFSLMKWAGLTSVFTGLAGYFSFGGLMNLGTAAAGRRAEAMGLGIQPGELKAIKTTFGTRVPAAAGMLNALSDLKADQSQWWKLRRLGISQEDIETKSAAELMPAYMAGLQSTAAKIPEKNWRSQLFASNVLEGTGVDIKTLRQLRDLGPELSKELLPKYLSNLTDFKETKEQDTPWARFVEQMNKSWEMFNTKMTTALAPLAEPISHVVDAFTNLASVVFHDKAFKDGIQSFADFIDRMARSLEKEETKKAVEDFIEKMGKAAIVVGQFIDKVVTWLGTEDAPKENPVTPGISPDPNTIPFYIPIAYHPNGGGFGGRKNNLLNAIMRAESGGNPNATSSAGAMGLMQLMPGTYADLRKNRPDLNLGSNPYDPVDNMKAGTAYIQQMLGMFGNDPEKALAAYNWGPGNLQKDIAAHGSRWRQYLPRETSQYVARVLGSSGGGNGGYSSVDVNLYVHQEAGSNTIINANQLKTRTTTRGVSA